MRRGSIVLVLALVTCVVTALAPSAAAGPPGPGSLDTSFGAGGRLVVPQVSHVSRDGEHLVALLPGPLGRFRVVTAGRYRSPDLPQWGDEFIAVRGYRANGSRDTTFHGGTTLVVPMPEFAAADSKTLYAAGSDATGRIVLMTAASDSGVRVAVKVQRITSSGQLEPSMFVLDSMPAGLPDTMPAGWSPGIVVLPSGALRLCVRGDEASYLIGLRPDNTPDPAFGHGPVPGYQVLPAGWTPECLTLAADPSGATYVASAGTVRAFDATGSPRTGWGGGSVTLTIPGWYVGVRAVTVTAAGVVYAAGATWVKGQPEKSFLARIGADGVLQPTFGSDGIRTYALPRRSMVRVVPATAGRVYLAFGSGATYVRASLLRVSGATGAPDTTFGSGGAVLYGLDKPAPIVLPVSATRVLVGATTSRPTTRYGVEVTARRA